MWQHVVSSCLLLQMWCLLSKPVTCYANFYLKASQQSHNIWSMWGCLVFVIYTCKTSNKTEAAEKNKICGKEKKIQTEYWFWKKHVQGDKFVIYSVSRTCALNARFRSVKLKVKAHKKYIKMTWSSPPPKKNFLRWSRWFLLYFWQHNGDADSENRSYCWIFWNVIFGLLRYPHLYKLYTNYSLQNDHTSYNTHLSKQVKHYNLHEGRIYLLDCFCFFVFFAI